MPCGRSSFTGSRIPALQDQKVPGDRSHGNGGWRLGLEAVWWAPFALFLKDCRQQGTLGSLSAPRGGAGIRNRRQAQSSKP